MAIKQKLLSPISLAVALTLSACGGGGGSSSNETPTASVPSTTPATSSTIDDEYGLWLTDLSNKMILPGYMAMQDYAEILLTESRDFCALSSPSDNELLPLQNAWAVFNESWQYMQWLKVGPVLEESRLFRVQLWPDSNDAVSRNIGNLLLEPNEITSEMVANQPVGAQGIPALEYLLFTTGDDSILSANDKDKRCQAVESIAQNLANISTSLYQGWLGSGGNYIEQVTSGTGDFTSRKDAVEELVTNWLEQIEKVKDEKMLEPLAINAPGLPHLIEFTLSEQSLTSIKINLNAFKGLFTAIDGHGFDNILTTHLEQQAISENMMSKLDAAIATASSLEGNFEDLLNDEQARNTITELIQNIREIRDLVTAEFVQATDINIGFNSNDGD